MQKVIKLPVTLAGDETATFQQSQLGTILVLCPSQPIVPMGALAEVLGLLGVRLSGPKQPLRYGIPNTVT